MRRTIRAHTRASVMIVLLLLTAAVSWATPLTWDIATVVPGGRVGVWTSLELAQDGAPRITHGDVNGALLWYDGASGQSEVIDGTGPGWASSLELDDTGEPHVSYWNQSTSQVMYAFRQSGSWVRRTVEVGLAATSLELVDDGDPGTPPTVHVAYGGYDGGGISVVKYAVSTDAGQTWQGLTADRVVGVGWFGVGGLALGLNGTAHVVYHDHGYGTLFCATSGAGTWNTEIVDDSGEGASNFVVVSDDLGRLHVSFLSGTNLDNYGSFDLKYALRDGVWQSPTTVDVAVGIGKTSICADGLGNPHISYFHAPNYPTGDLKYATLIGGTWCTDFVDISDSQYTLLGDYNSIAVGSDGRVHISYVALAASGPSDLRYARSAPVHHDIHVTISEPITVDEGGSVEVTAVGSDELGHALAYTWDLDSDGQFGDATGEVATFSALDLDGPTSASISVTATCDHSETATDDATVNIVNVAPIAVADVRDVDEDTFLEVAAAGVLANDSDLPDDPLSATLVSDVSHGSLVLNSDGSFTYTPEADYNGEDTFTYTASDDDAGTSAVATVTVTVNAKNDLPTPADDNTTTDEDTPVTVNVLANDSDVDGDTLSVTWVSSTPHGTAEINPDETITYTPNADCNGSDSFRYKVEDGQGGDRTATVTVTIDPMNDAPVCEDDLAVTDEDTSVVIDVLHNDTDVDGDILSISLVSSPPNGDAVVSGGKIEYTPEVNYNQKDTFTYTVSDGEGAADTGTVNVTINPVNDAPVADSQPVETDEDTSLDITLTGSDVDGDTVAYALASQPSHGTLTGDAPDLTYTPDANYHGSDSFTYKVNDGTDDSNVATVSITVESKNDNPTGVGDEAETDEDTSVTVHVLANDSDVDGDPLSITNVSSVPHGSAVLNADDTITYTPNADYNGPDSFTYTIDDGQGGSIRAAVNITVNPVNDAPVAADDVYGVAEDDVLSIAAPGILGNDGDTEGDSLTASVVTTTSDGVLVLAADGSFTYTPDANFDEDDSFTYKVNDGTDDSNVATVSITVESKNDNPTGVGDEAETDEDTSVTVDVLANDSDVDGDPLSITNVSSVPHGSAVLNADDTITYTPNADYNGPDSFTYTIDDGQGGSIRAAVNITVNPVNDAPVAADDVGGVAEDDVLSVSAPGVLGNDSDTEGDALAASVVTTTSDGVLVLAADGSYTYTPSPNFHGDDSFTYKVNDGTDDSNIATVSITVDPKNDNPTGVGDGAETDEDTSVTVDVLANDSDVDGDPLSITNVSSVPHGSAVLNADDTITYTPNADYNGPDSFTYTLYDGVGGSVSVTVSITVTPVNDAPVCVTDLVAMVEDTVVDIDVLHNDTDVDDDVLTISAVVQPAHGTAEILAGKVRYTPDANYDEEDTLTYTVSDGNGGTDTGTVNITIAPVNDAPIADDQGVETDEDTPLDIIVTGSDIEGDPLTYSIVEEPAHGRLSGDAPNVIYTPYANYHGSDSFTFKVNDGELDSVIATVDITLMPVNDAPVLGAIMAPIAPVQVSTSIAASAPFTDVDEGDTHTATWQWGDRSASDGSIVEPTQGAPGSVSGDHSYSTPGVYTITLTLTDAGGLCDQAIYEYVVVYDPSGGFVTGGGWITSPPGAYALDPSLTGKANFGFVSRYKKGADAPTGQTEFQFHAAGLDFHSTSYQWLVIAGTKAKFKGTGAIGGLAEAYGFMLSANDGQLNGAGGVDKFRIKIWDESTEAVVYDNQMGAADDAEPTTALGGGSIVIHKAKENDGAASRTTAAAITNASSVSTRAGAQITFTLSAPADVAASVLNIAGRPVKSICRAKACDAGTDTLLWDAQADNGLRVPNGTYLVEIEACGANGSRSRALTQLRLNR